jgi:CRP-like cAMP-binding protein
MSPVRFELLAPVPAVALARKLRLIPLFRFASVDELFRIATIARQVRYPAGTMVQEQGAPADYIQVLLEGHFEVADRDGERTLDPPALVGFQEVLEGTSIRERVRSKVESIALVMASEEFRTLLSANIELAQGLFRLLLESSANGERPSTVAASRLEAASGGDPLKAVDKVLYLQSIPFFARADGDELFEVAAITRELDLEPDAILFSEGDPASILVLLSGEMELMPASGGDTFTMTAGQCIGVDETLAGASWPFRGRVTVAGKALEIHRELLFELLSDRLDLLQAIFGAVFQRKKVSETEEK